MDIIHLLPDSVANQIAAGEVIQRPASVIKELVENAVDAGARRIDVLVVDAGRTSIQVIDDGKGMSETDARLAFERHATSKILKAQDLFSLRTMGFRGEALPSIAAVAQVTLRTRMAEHDLGTCLSIEGGRVISQDIDACPVGANFLVQNLFFNIPARRKFLKSNQTELSNIVQEFERIALVNPDIHFTLTHNDNLITDLPISSVHQRIVGVFGKRVGDQLLKVDTETTLCRITGFVGRPDAARKKGVHQYFFVNGRYMRHPYFHRAVMEAFNGLIQPTEQVPYFLYFEVDPANIDVNIHPTKTEIKFEDEVAIWQIVVSTIRATLGKHNAIPNIDFDTDDRPDMPVFDALAAQQSKSPTIDIDHSYNPFTSSGRASYTPPRHQNELPLYEGLERQAAIPSQLDFEDESDETESTLFTSQENAEMEKSNQHFQYHGQYIMTAVKSGLMIIDQHRAHVRVLYDKYRQQMQNHTAASQGLLFPEMLQLPISDAVHLDNMLEPLHNLGFEMSALGGGSYSIQGVPAGMEGINLQQLIGEMISRSADKGTDISNDINHRIALTMARNAAITAGEYMNNEQMEHLVTELFATTTPNYTPDGKVVITILKEEDMLRMF